VPGRRPDLPSKSGRFVEGLDAYDQVVTYDRVPSLPADVPNRLRRHGRQPRVVSAIHHHFRDGLKHSSVVGLTHWEERRPEGDLPGCSRRSSSRRRRSRSGRRTGDPTGFKSATGAAWRRFRRRRDGSHPTSSTVRDRRPSSACTAKPLEGRTKPTRAISSRCGTDGPSPRRVEKRAKPDGACGPRTSCSSTPFRPAFPWRAAELLDVEVLRRHGVEVGQRPRLAAERVGALPHALTPLGMQIAEPHIWKVRIGSSVITCGCPVCGRSVNLGAGPRDACPTAKRMRMLDARHHLDRLALLGHRPHQVCRRSASDVRRRAR